MSRSTREPGCPHLPKIAPVIRLAGLLARRPGRVAVLSALVCLLGALGFLRWSVDAGQDLLVGRNSAAQKVADRFGAKFGADPLVLVFTAHQPGAFYVEQNNLLKMVALESDIARNTAVASVLGPGTVVEAAQRAAQNQIQKTVQQYNQYVYDRALLQLVSNAGGDPAKIDAATLQKFESDSRQAATVAQFQATPAGATAPFCPPKQQWAAVLPPPAQGQPSYAVITVRLTTSAAADARTVAAVRSCIQADLDKGGQHCSSTKPTAARLQTLQPIGRLQLTECGASPDQQPQSGNCPYLADAIAGAPLLAHGV